MSERGFTLLEVLLAVSLMGVVLVGVLPAFVTHSDAATRNELRSGAAAAAQQIMESLRRDNPGTLPTTGNSAVQTVFVGDRAFEVVTRYCVIPAFCDADSRHLTADVSVGGEFIYSVETVFTDVK